MIAQLRSAVKQFGFLKPNPPKVYIVGNVPLEYLKPPPPSPAPEPDKRKILDAWKDGAVIEGAEISQGNRVEIR
jgi:hypothetical protein